MPCPPLSWEFIHPGHGLAALQETNYETNACCSPCSLLCPYSAMATYSATCANNSPAQGINMANSIANLRLKAKEYSLQRNQVPTVNWGKKILNRPKKKSKTIRNLSCFVISSSAGKKNKSKQTIKARTKILGPWRRKAGEEQNEN